MKHSRFAFLRLKRADGQMRSPWFIIAVLTLLTFAAGAVRMGEPLEDMMRGVRNIIRAHPASGEIVVVGIDDKTADALGGFNYSRKYDAALVENLMRAGAKAVIYDKMFVDKGDAEGDAKFAATLKKYQGRVYIGATGGDSRKKTVADDTLPTLALRNGESIVSVSAFETPFAFSVKFPYSDTISGNEYRSISLTAAEKSVGKKLKRFGFFRPDLSVNPNTIPTFSFVDLVTQSSKFDKLNGKVVLIGDTAKFGRDSHKLMFYGFIPGVYFQASAAETLRKQYPVDFGFYPFIALGFVAAIAALFFRQEKYTWLPVAVIGAIFAILPFILDNYAITVDLIPGFILSISAHAIATTRHKVIKSQEKSPVSGLPNIVVLRRGQWDRNKTVIALKIRNYSAIVAAFNSEFETELIDSVSRKIAIAENNVVIYHNDDTLLWLSDMKANSELVDHLEGLARILSASTMVYGRNIDLLISIGIDDGIDRKPVSRIASAMLCAEEAAEVNRLTKIYDSERLNDAEWDLSLLSSLESGIGTGEVWVAYQPKLHLQSGIITGVEALARWTHSERGMINPTRFIPLAEKYNRVDNLTMFILETAIADAAKISKKQPDFCVAVNLSPQLLLRSDLAERIKWFLQKHKFLAKNLTLEITENGTLDVEGVMLVMMYKLAGLGVTLSVDDYGTGNATLHHLSTLPADEVKIDMEFVIDIEHNEDHCTLVRSTVELIHSLNRKVVAEGVESPQGLRMLQDMGCDYAQGYLIGKPTAYTGLLAVLKSKPLLLAA